MDWTSSLERDKGISPSVRPSVDSSDAHKPTLEVRANPYYSRRPAILSFQKMGRRNTPAAICLLHAVAGCFTMGNAQAQPPPPPQQLTETVSRTVSAVITVAISAFFVLVFFCVLVNQCRRSEDAGQGAGEGGRQGSIGRRGRGLDPAGVAALPIVTYVEIRKHKSGVLECAVCLTEFDDGDDVRLLPQCSHAFHPDCIDPWLEGHVTCPLCRANLEKEPAPAGAPPSPQPQPQTQTPEAVAVRVEEVESDEDERREEAVELERLRSVRRAARMSRSHSTGHSLSMTSAPAPAEVGDDHERFTVRLPPHVREEVLKSRRLRHATSLVVGLGGSSREGSSRGRGGSWHGARRWPSYLARTVSWARGGGEGSVRKGGAGAETGTMGMAVPP